MLVSLVGLTLVAPLLLVTSLAILLDDGVPIFYRQRRAGRAGRPFELLKFRSMRVNEVPPEQMGQVRHGHPMITRVGRLIRRTKIDELPQFVNVLRGDMSLVGPRPALVSDLDGYDEFDRRRLLVRPGITGWTAVNGAVQLTWPERIVLDVWYVDHGSFHLDLAILVRTIWVVLGGERARPAALEAARRHAMAVRQGA